MATSERIVSDLAVPPGEYLQEVIDDIGMSQAELSRRLGRPVQVVNEIVKGSKAITPETAIQLEQVLPVPAHVWTGLEETYRLALARQAEAQKLDAECDVIDAAVYRALAEYGEVADIDGRSKEGRRARVREMRRFFSVASLRNVPQLQTFRVAFRVGVAGRVVDYALAAWLRWGERHAREQVVEGHYDEKALRELIPWLRTCTLEEPSRWLPEVQEALSRCGVVLVLVPHLPKTNAHGAAYWLSPDTAVIQLSIRMKRADIFWFSFFHEIAHLLQHRKRDVLVSWGAKPGRDSSVVEREADEFAGEVLIPGHDYADFLARCESSEAAIRAFATRISIHPSIVLGRLQRDDVVPHRTNLNRRLHQWFEWSSD